MGQKLNRDEAVLRRSPPFRTALTFLTKVLYGQERSIIALVLLFILAMAGLLWKMFSLSDDLARGLVLQGAELQSVLMEEIRHYYSSEIVARIKGVDGIEVTHNYKTKDHAIPLPATMTIELGKRISEREQGFQVRL